MFRIICLIIGYALGCIQSAYFVGKFVGHIDIRDYGSGNAGFTNVTRVLGKKAGKIVFFLDILKVVAAYFICSLIFDGDGSFINGTSLLPGLYGGLGAVLGHNFPFYIGFKGGKGIACTLGLMLLADWRVALITYAIGFAAFMAKHYISLASLTMAFVYPVLMLLLKNTLGFEAEEILLMFILCILAFIKHKSNIQRLINGTESRFSNKDDKPIISEEKKAE